MGSERMIMEPEREPRFTIYVTLTRGDVVRHASFYRHTQAEVNAYISLWGVSKGFDRVQVSAVQVAGLV